MKKLLSRSIVSFYLLIQICTAYSQDVLHTPYPIIFIHGLNSNYRTWYGNSIDYNGNSGRYDNVFDYLTGVDNLLKYGGNLNVTLDHDRSTTTLSNTITEDVHLFTKNLNFGDFYTINFAVNAKNQMVSRASDFLLPVITSTTQTEIKVFNISFYSIGDIICVGNEYMLVEGIGESTISVKRGILESVATIHDKNEVLWDLSNESNQASIVKQGWGVKQVIDAVKLKTGAKKVILVGHSMGGLAAREYIRSYGGSDVAKLVTIGTPHLGSTAAEISTSADPIIGIDIRSDAVRDLSYNYTGLSADPQPPYGNLPDNGTYLFGGKSEKELKELRKFYSSDVNADGNDEDDKREGLNAVNSVDSVKSLPKTISYSWIISELDVTTTLKLLDVGYNLLSPLIDRVNKKIDGDICVRFHRQFPWVGYWTPTGGVPKPAIGNIITTNKVHTSEPTDYYALLRGLDEPEDPNLAYTTPINGKTKGFITFQENEVAVDNDLYKIVAEKDGALKISLMANVNSRVIRITLFDYLMNEIYTATNIDEIITRDVKSGEGYFIRIQGLADTDSYKYPYTLVTNFTETPSSSLLNVQGDELKYYDVVVNNYREKIITLTNKSTSDIIVTGITLTGINADQFAVIDGNAGFTIAAGTTKDLAVRFNPTSVGIKNAVVNIANNTTDSPLKSITVNGNGVDNPTKVLVMTPAFQYNFGNGYVSKSKSKIFTLQNTGSNTMSVTALNIGGLAANDFAIAASPNIPFTLETGETKQISVEFSPSVIGVRDGNLIIGTNADNATPQQSIPLYGNGINGGFSGVDSYINAYEYWFDNNYTGKVYTTVKPQETSTINATFPTDGLNVGLHTLHIRFKDTKGKWGSVVSQYFYRMPITPDGSRSIKAYEYWFDNDYNSKTSQSVSGQSDFQLISDIDAAKLNTGLHAFHIRFKDDIEKWSSVESQYFYKMPLTPNGSRSIKAYEYWFDNDYNFKTSQAASGQSDFQLISDIDAAKLNTGLHAFHVRFKDDNEKWSSVVSQYIYKMPITAGINNLITAYRYWFDNTSSLTSTVQLPNPVDPYELINNIDAGKLSKGDHTIHLQFQDVSHQWSSVLSSTFNSDYTLPPKPVSAFTSDITTLCKGSTVNFVNNSIQGNQYLWNFGDGGTSTEFSPTHKYEAKGTFTVSLKVSDTESDQDSLLVKTNYITVNAPDATISSSKSTSFCQGETTTLTASLGNSYLWSNGKTERSISVSTTGDYSVIVTDNNGCSENSKPLTITVNPLPIAADKIIGITTVIQGQATVTYTVPTIANATSYVWTLPSGTSGTSTTNSIVVNYSTSATSGNITVKGVNSCGTGEGTTLAITVNPLAYTVTYLVDNAQQSATTVSYSSKATEPTLTKLGYHLDGWYQIIVGLGEVKYDFNTPVTSNLTLRARWVVNTYTITGTVTGADGVTVELSGDVTNSKTVNNGETYSFNVNYGQSVVVTASKPGCSFVPGSYTLANVTGNKTANNFVASINPYTIAGTISGADGVTVALSGDVTDSKTVNNGETYSFTVNYGQSVVVTASKPGYSFVPGSYALTNVTENKSTNNFVASVNSFTIAGTISGADGVTVALSGDVTDSKTVNNGEIYSFTVNYGQSVVVTASKPGYFFVPGSYTLANVTGNKATNNFVASVTTSVDNCFETNISCYPNPVKSTLIIKLPANDEIVSVQICSITGDILYWVKDTTSKSFFIDVNGYPSGVFIVKIINNKEGVAIIKIIKE